MQDERLESELGPRLESVKVLQEEEGEIGISSILSRLWFTDWMDRIKKSGKQLNLNAMKTRRHMTLDQED